MRLSWTIISTAPSANVDQQGGGGGFSCNEPFPGGPPAYTDYAFNTIGGSASVTGLRTCWDGFSHNTGGGNVQLVDNQTAIEDGNLVTAISSGTI